MNFPLILLNDYSVTAEGVVILAAFGIPAKVETRVEEILISSEQELEDYALDQGADSWMEYGDEITFIFDYEGECNFSLPFKEVQP